VLSTGGCRAAVRPAARQPRHAACPAHAVAGSRYPETKTSRVNV